MRISDYDRVNRCCRICKTGMPFTKRDLKSHTQADCLIDQYYNDLKWAKARKEVSHAYYS